jgi:phosphoribosylglycinamide formyltransferase-1
LTVNRRVAVLISGRGSNFQAIAGAIRDGRLPATIGIVVSDRADAAGLRLASELGIRSEWVNPKEYGDREAYDRAIVALLREHDIDLVCLAGFMRRVRRPLLEAYPNRILNIHPSLLPAFPGLHAQRQAIEYGVRVAGATVHLVTEELDAGPIVLQAAVPVFDADTVETLSSRILTAEHRIYPEAIGVVLEGRWSLDGRRFVRK